MKNMQEYVDDQTSGHMRLSLKITALTVSNNVGKQLSSFHERRSRVPRTALHTVMRQLKEVAILNPLQV